ncbi:hypothetical protein [Paraburkholderia terrae]|uniref:hypothetical protein n=1 Tax=Paraburkholderia terrae TaxID=311230 RepID=UPI0033654414
MGQPGDSWRMDVSREYLGDARRGGLSPATRLKCAWEAIYFCCCEVAERRGGSIDGLDHPAADVVEHLLQALSVSQDERRQVEALFRWTSNMQTLSLAPCSPAEACDLAEALHLRTAAFLSAE